MNEEQMRAEFEVWYKGKYWSRLSDRAVSIAFRTKSNGEYDSYRISDAWEIWRAALASQAKSVLPNQEPLGSEFEKVLYENLDSLYETDVAPQPTDERVLELERALELFRAATDGEIMTTLQALIVVPMNEDGIERADKVIAEMFNFEIKENEKSNLLD